MSSNAPRFSVSERTGEAILKLPSSGGEISVVNGQDVKEKLDRVHNVNDDLKWILLSYEGESTNVLKEFGSGTGSVGDIQPLLNDKMIAYALVKVLDVLAEQSSVKTVSTYRFALIVFIGDHVSGARKARIATNKQSVLKFIGHYNVEIAFSDVPDITDENVCAKVQDASGSRIHEKTMSSQDKAQRYQSGAADEPQTLKPKLAGPNAGPGA
eukprot:JZ552860.1.p1 GENE.JZ552860.1~~JZ552860.1.p1  ORF type:complete len:212 (+),score=29.20 JZ552860.1:11-646(+)